MNKSRGFSLLELLIVVAIILIIATIAIPSLLRSRQAANESSSVSNIRAINTAQVMYVSTNSNYGTFGDLSGAGLMDDRFSADGVTVGGYPAVPIREWHRQAASLRRMAGGTEGQGDQKR